MEDGGAAAGAGAAGAEAAGGAAADGEPAGIGMGTGRGAAPLSGGLAPLVATAHLAWSGGDPWPVGVYLIGMAAVTVVSILLAAETHRDDLAGR